MSRVVLVAFAALLLAAPAYGAPIEQQRVTAHYRLRLVVGPLETMYTLVQERAKHPKTGELMLGSPTMGGPMAMGNVNRHLEVHVYLRANGRVLADPPSSITLTDASAMSGMAIATKVAPVAMQGVGEGNADLHYGNNVHLTPGHTYKVAVVVKGERASFTVHV